MTQTATAAPTALNPAWYGSTVVPVLEALPQFALGAPADRRTCDKLYALLLTLADDVRAIGEAFPE